MTPIVMTWILWGILATTNPNVSVIVVLDEFPDRDECMEIAQQTAVAAVRDIAEQKIPGVESITVVCLPVLTRESADTLTDGKPKKHLRTEPVG